MMKINNKWLPYMEENKPYKVRKVDSTIVDINILLTSFRRLVKYNDQSYECYLTNTIDDNIYLMFYINEQSNMEFDFIEQVVPVNFVEMIDCNNVKLTGLWFDQSNMMDMYIVKYNEVYNNMKIMNINMFRGEISLNGELRKCYIYNIQKDDNKLTILLQVHKDELVSFDLLVAIIDMDFAMDLSTEAVGIICSNCTLKNTITSNLCSCCSTKLTSILSYETQKNDWSCIECTFINNEENINCIVCDTSKDWDYPESDNDQDIECSVCGDNTNVKESITCNSDTKHTVCDGCFENSMKNQIGPDNLRNFKSNDLKLVCCMCNDKLSEKDTALHLSKDGFEEYIKARDKIVHAKAEVETEERVRKLLQNVPNNQQHIKQHIDHIIQNILTLKCGNCNQAFVDFVGCFALTCNSCKQNFCGWCLEVSNNSLQCHNHVRSCQYNIMRGELFNTVEAFEIAQNANRCYYIQEYMGTIHQYNIKKQIFDAIETNLNELGIYEDFNYFCPNNKKKRYRNKKRNQYYINV